MQLKDILPILKGVRTSGSGFIALCPAHDDRNPSLSISESDGKPLLYCHAGCSFEAIVQALGISKSNSGDRSSGFPPSHPQNRDSKSTGSAP